MEIIVAPDSFKGSVSAKEACGYIKKGILNVISVANVLEMPLADGGEGTVENMVYSSQGFIINTNVEDPIGRKIDSSYGVLGDDNTVVIEMAKASGLPLVNETEKNPLNATSFGTGELIIDALDKGYRNFIIGLGGSATNDGGMGMLQALGVKFLDSENKPLASGGAALSQLSYIDDSELDHRIKSSSFTLACDVTNYLCGKEGASEIFGPQKGATPNMIKILDQALYRFAEVVFEQKKIDMSLLKGGGAAGGMGAAMLTFLGAQFKTGIKVIMEEIDFETSVRKADLIITGEGKLDSQTISGKVISGVTNVAKKSKVPVIALAGEISIETKDFNKLELLAAFSIVPGPCSIKEAIENTEYWMTQRTESFMRIFQHLK